MREIKFRLWDTETNKMYYSEGDYYGVICINPFTGSMSEWVSVCEGQEYWGPLDNLKPLQSTGLTDKNGKEIYEGDIIETRGGLYFLDGTNDEDEFGISHSFDFHDFIYNVLYSESHSGLGGFSRDDISVVGNIYENPELLPTE